VAQNCPRINSFEKWKHPNKKKLKRRWESLRNSGGSRTSVSPGQFENYSYALQLTGKESEKLEEGPTILKGRCSRRGRHIGGGGDGGGSGPLLETRERDTRWRVSPEQDCRKEGLEP